MSSLERSWPYQRPVYSGAILALRQAPGDPCGPARASRPHRRWLQARQALPPVCLIRKQPAATAILHGLARRTAPQTPAPRSGSRASRWPVQESPARMGAPAGLQWYGNGVWPVLGHPRVSTLKISHTSRFCTRKAPARSRGQVAQRITNGRRCGLPPPRHLATGGARRRGDGYGPAASPV